MVSWALHCWSGTTLLSEIPNYCYPNHQAHPYDLSVSYTPLQNISLHLRNAGDLKLVTDTEKRKQLCTFLLDCLDSLCVTHGDCASLILLWDWGNSTMLFCKGRTPALTSSTRPHLNIICWLPQWGHSYNEWLVVFRTCKQLCLSAIEGTV